MAKHECPNIFYWPPLAQTPGPPDYGYTSAELGAPAPYPGSVVQLNSIGKWVIMVQYRCQVWGFDPGCIDGRFGPDTLRAVVGFQHFVRLPRNGIVDEYTWWWLWRKPLPPEVRPGPRNPEDLPRRRSPAMHMYWRWA